MDFTIIQVDVQQNVFFRVSLLYLFTYSNCIIFTKGSQVLYYTCVVKSSTRVIVHIFQIMHVILILLGNIETTPGPSHLHVTQFTLYQVGHQPPISAYTPIWWSKA